MLGCDHAKIASAEVNSTAFARARGLVTLASPSQKSSPLLWFLWRLLNCAAPPMHSICRLPGVQRSSSADHLCRFCSAVFGVVDASGVDANKPKLLPLSRVAAQELVLLSILCPLASADLSAPLDTVLYAADASEDKSGYVQAEVGTEVTRPLWRTATKKGGYSRPWSREEVVLSPFYDKTRFRAQGCCWRWHLPPTAAFGLFFRFP